MADYNTWETRFVLLLWLGILCLIPFDLSSVDSSGALIPSIIQTGQQYLGDSGPCRDAAAFCLTSLLTRPDMEEKPLRAFLENAIVAVEMWSGQVDPPLFGPEYCSMLGRVTCLAQLFKRGHRLRLLPHAAAVLTPCLSISSSGKPLQVLLRKLLVKLFQRIGVTFLPPAIAKWRYQRGQRSLQIGQSKHDTDGQADEAVKEELQEEEDEEVYVPSEMEDIIERLVSALSDKDTGEFQPKKICTFDSYTFM